MSSTASTSEANLELSDAEKVECIDFLNAGRSMARMVPGKLYNIFIFTIQVVENILYIYIIFLGTILKISWGLWKNL